MGLPDVTVLVVAPARPRRVMPPMQGWPIPVEPPPVPEPAVSLAIMRQESNFDIGIISPSGARGLMQLMPATARPVAHRLGEPTSATLLTTDPGHNMRMGTAYLLEVLEKFDNSVPLAAAAYNAGPNRVTQWLAENGDPRVGDQSMIDWIEMIPFNETRNYVQRVLENVVVYQARPHRDAAARRWRNGAADRDRRRLGRTAVPRAHLGRRATVCLPSSVFLGWCEPARISIRSCHCSARAGASLRWITPDGAAPAGRRMSCVMGRRRALRDVLDVCAALHLHHVIDHRHQLWRTAGDGSGGGAARAVARRGAERCRAGNRQRRARSSCGSSWRWIRRWRASTPA